MRLNVRMYGLRVIFREGEQNMAESVSIQPRLSDQPVSIQPRLSDQPVSIQPRLSDQPFSDNTVYGSDVDDSISDATENVAITYHSITIDGTTIPYTARAGHLVTYDQDSARPSAKIFYVSFTVNDVAASGPSCNFLL